MTSPNDAAKTSRFTDAEFIHAASALERERAEDRAEFGALAFEYVEPPRPVPMTDPIEDVTNPANRANETGVPK